MIAIDEGECVGGGMWLYRMMGDCVEMWLCGDGGMWGWGNVIGGVGCGCDG